VFSLVLPSSPPSHNRDPHHNTTAVLVHNNTSVVHSRVVDTTRVHSTESYRYGHDSRAHSMESYRYAHDRLVVVRRSSHCMLFVQ